MVNSTIVIPDKMLFILRTCSCHLCRSMVFNDFSFGGWFDKNDNYFVVDKCKTWNLHNSTWLRPFSMKLGGNWSSQRGNDLMECVHAWKTPTPGIDDPPSHIEARSSSILVFPLRKDAPRCEDQFPPSFIENGRNHVELWRFQVLNIKDAGWGVTYAGWTG